MNIKLCRTFPRLHAVRLMGCLGLLILLTASMQCTAGTVSGTVTRSGGGAISGALVRTEGEPSYSAITGADGTYRLTLPTGTFTVLASASGYNPQRMAVLSVVGTVNFALNSANTGTTLNLPAPLTWGEPPSAPSAPGDSYPIAFADNSTLPDPNAPRIADYNDCVKPNESFTLAGANFTTRTGVDAGTDTTVWIWARTSSSAGVLRQAQIWKASAGTIVATVPDDVPFGMYMVWVENSVGVSAPICLNRTKAIWVGPIDNTTYAGGTKRVFGRNLSYGHGTSSAYVYIQPASGGSFTQCTVTSVEPYVVAFTIPAGTANGNYKVFVHNGQGGVFGWGDGLDLVVDTQWMRGTGQMNLTPSGNDDTTQIQNAINTVSGYTNGGVVRLASGNYTVSSTITLSTNVELRGAGMNSSTVFLHGGSVSVGGDHAALTDLTLHEVYGYGRPSHEFYCAAGNANVVVSGVRIDSDQGDDSWPNVNAVSWLGTGTEVHDCEMYREVLSQWNCWIHNNNLYGDVGPWVNAESACELFGWNNVFEYNHAETLNWPYDDTDPNHVRRNYKWWNYYYKIWAKRLAILYCDNSYVAHNTTLNVGVDDNKGEIILLHGHWCDWGGQVLSNNGLTATVRTDGTVFGQTYTIPNAYSDGTPYYHLAAGGQLTNAWDYWAVYAGARHMAIIAGTGAGQARLIQGDGITPPNQITVDSPWTVQPDSTSVALFTGFWQNNIIYANNLQAFPVDFSFDPAYDYSGGYASNGVQLDGSCLHNSIEGNSSYRTNYARNILGISGGPSLWNDMRDEYAEDCNTFGYRIQQMDANPLGPVLFGNAYRNCRGNISGTSQTFYAPTFGALGQGEGSIIENSNITGTVGYRLGNVDYGSTGTPTLYRNGTMTVSSGGMPVYVETNNGEGMLVDNTYSGSSRIYNFNSNSYGLGVTSYTQLVPLNKVARFTTASGGGVLSAVQVPIANAGTASMAWNVVSSSPWINATIQANGTVSAEGTDGSLSITPDSTGMSVGRHWGSVTVYTANSSVKVGVLVDVTSGSQVAAPTFSPPSATKTGSQSIAISTTTGGATIRFTTDGTTPTSSTGTIYSGSVTITESTVLKAIAYRAGMTDSAVTTIAAVAPSFSLAPGAYGGTHSVTITTITSGATIRYTTDGTIPTQSVGTVYSGSINLSTSCKLQAIAYKTGMADSSVTTGLYTIVNQTWSLVGDFSSTAQGNNGWYYGMRTGTGASFSLFGAPSGLYTGSLFALQANPGVIMWGAWTDGGGCVIYAPNATTLSRYAGPTASGPMAAGTVGLATCGNNFPVMARWIAAVEGNYSYNVTFTRPVNATNGVYVAKTDTVANTRTVLGTESYLSTTNTSVSFSGTQNLVAGQALDFSEDAADSGGTNCYYSWGTDNYGNSSTQATVVLVSATITVGSGSGNTVASPSFSLAAGTYTNAQTVAISCATNGATIRYTTDGTTPTSSTGTVYSSAITVDRILTLKAIAYKSGMTDSPVTSVGYTICCAAPTFNPSAGTYTGTQSVTITTTTTGASIRYTTDGTTPSDTVGTVYSSAVSIDQNRTLKAVAYKSGMGNSTVTSGGYTINCVAPTFNPVAGTYTSTQSVTISTTTSGASIRYTTDGTTPSDTVGTVYSSAVSVPRNLTLKAIAYKTNMPNSTVTSGDYTIAAPGWSLVGDFSSSAQGNRSWYYGFSTGSGASFSQLVTPSGLYTGAQFALQASPGVVMWGSWGDGGTCCIYAPNATTLSRYAGPTASGPMAAGTVGLATCGNNFPVMARWVAAVDGDYTYNVTFTRPVNATNGVYVTMADPSANTRTVLVTESYLSTTNTSVSYSGTQHLVAGQCLEFVEDPKDSGGSNCYYEWGMDNYGNSSSQATVALVAATISGS